MTHSRFKISIILDEHSLCSISHTPDIAELIKQTKLIIWDEAPMQHCYSFECIARSMRDIMKAVDPGRFHMPFRGITVVLDGDFFQILPAITRASHGDIISLCITHSKLWKITRVFKLRHNMRLARGNTSGELQDLRDFAEWVLDIGNGNIGTPNEGTNGDGGDDICFPKRFCHLTSEITIESMMESTFLDFMQHYQDPDYLSGRAILTHTNETVGHVNSIIVEKLQALDDSTDEWRLKVRAQAVWKGITRQTGEFRGFSIIFIDDYRSRYLDRINEGPHKPTKLSLVVADQPSKTVPKEKSEYTAEDISSIANDAKVRHLLHSAIDNVMLNRVINCKTAKEIWDALEIKCQGIDAIKKNMRTILSQEYEHFDSKPDESLTGLYDRFVKLLNDLSLVDKEYDLEDNNLKFLLALPGSWDLKATTIRDKYALDETTLDEIYGMLKTHELEMDQRSKRHGRKSRTVALNADEESPKMAVSKKGKGKALITKSDTESSSSDNDEDSETESLSEMDADEEMMRLYALMVKGITKIAYRKFRRGNKFSRKSGSSDKKGFRKSEGKAGKSNRGYYSNVKCYNYGEKGHISPDCKKGKGDKGKALVTKKKNWTDTSDSEDEVNYALMANADSSSDAAELKVPQTTYAFHTDDITELRSYHKTIFISYRDQTLTCDRLTSENLAFKKRNDYLEKELGMFHQTQKERDDAFYVRDEVLKLNQSLKTVLEKEREIIRTSTNSGKTTQNLLSSGNWKEGLGYGDDKSEM
ncbi:hypothetical protein AgCh_005489 [Apium graveolens]